MKLCPPTEPMGYTLLPCTCQPWLYRESMVATALQGSNPRRAPFTGGTRLDHTAATTGEHDGHHMTLIFHSTNARKDLMIMNKKKILYICNQNNQKTVGQIH